MPELIPCTWCAKPFTPTRSDGLFHSGACKQAYWRWKHRVDHEYHSAYEAIREIERYLYHDNTKQHAENLLGQLADYLHALGFEHDETQLPLPEEAYTLSNQLGVENHE